MASAGPSSRAGLAPLAATLAGLLALGLHAATAARTVPLGDSGELIAAAAALGVAHPPGYPLYVVLGRLALLVPVGEPAVRMNLLSAILAACCCAAVAWLVARHTANPLAAVAAGVTLAVSSTFWGAATVAEVYTLHLALVGGLLVAATAFTDGRRGADTALALLLGLGLAHRPTVLLALPAVALLGGSAWRGLSYRRWGWLVSLAAAVPVVCYGGMMLRSAAGPVANWGRPDDWNALLSHVGTRAYRYYSIGLAGWLRADGWSAFGQTVLQGFGWAALPLGVLGVAEALRQRERRAIGSAVVALFVVQALFALTYLTQDSEVLFLPAHVALAIGAGLGLATLARVTSVGAVALAIVCVVAPFLLNLPTRNLAGFTAGDDFARDMLRSVPQDGVLYVDGDNAFLLAYALQVRGDRPDVTVYDRNGQLFADELENDGPAPLRGESRAAWRIRREQAFATASARPVVFMTWPGYELPRGWRFDPEGLFYRVRPAESTGASAAELRALWDDLHEERITRQAIRLDDPFALTIAATYPLMRGERHRVERRTSSMRTAFAAAARLAERSESIHNYLGTVYGRGGAYADAIAEFEAALAIKPVSVRAWNNLAFARSLAGDREGARAAWRRSLELDGNQPDVAARLR